MSRLKVLVACEFSGVVREAFNQRAGVDAVSCDLLPAEDGRFDFHKQCDVISILNDGWDLMLAFPPCTHLCVSGARWFMAKRASGEQQAAEHFFLNLVERSDIDRICIENPIGIMSTRYRKPDQIIQPWQHGHGETKATCLWLKNLPLLKPSNVVSGRETRIHHMSPGPNRSRERSRTYSGIAQAMATQWSNLI